MVRSVFIVRHPSRDMNITERAENKRKSSEFPRHIHFSKKFLVLFAAEDEGVGTLN